MTKLIPFMSHTYDLPFDLIKSNPHIFYPNHSTIFFAIIFSSGVKQTRNLCSLPNLVLFTLPSRVGDFLNSAWAYSGPTAYLEYYKP